MRYYGKIQHREYTDLAVLIGPSIRRVEDDYEDLQQLQPEVLLGYRVLLMTGRDIVSGRLRGRRVMKFVILDGNHHDHEWTQMTREIRPYLEYSPWAKVEHWHVHRRLGIWKIV